jgi:N-formylglutamate amidohydrolase
VRWAVVVLTAAVIPGCTSAQNTINQQEAKLESLGATAQMIGEVWLGGQVSATYAETALQETQTQVELQRAVLAANVEVLQNPRGADLSQRAERLSRVVVQLLHDVEASDGSGLRRHLLGIPIVPGSR